jgi:hypothetical protein
VLGDAVGVGDLSGVEGFEISISSLLSEKQKQNSGNNDYRMPSNKMDQIDGKFIFHYLYHH